MLTPNTTQIPSTSSHHTPHRRRSFIAIAFGVFLIGLCVPAHAQTLLPDARLIEWDCPLVGAQQPTPPADPSPGALVADGNFVWFVTTLGQQRLVRFTPGADKATNLATCMWWDLGGETDPAVNPAGLRLKPAGTTAYIRDLDQLIRLETTTDRRTKWFDGLISFSDVSTGPYNGSGTAIYTTGIAGLQPDGAVQRFVPSSNGTATGSRWDVGGGAGLVYLSGIDAHPDKGKGHLVYYSEPFTNMIGELNTTAGTVRRWSLSGLATPPSDPSNPPDAVDQPRQLDVAFGGMVWVVTGSGHLVRLNPTTDEILVAPIPTLAAPAASPLNNPIGVDAEGVVGYTTAGEVAGFNKVGFLVPEGLTTVVPPTSGPAPREDFSVEAVPQTIPRFAGPAVPFIKTAVAQEVVTTGGTIFETFVDSGVPVNATLCGSGIDPDPSDEFPASPDDPCMPSTLPRGIDNDPKGGPGDYYAAIGGSVLRLAHVSIPTEAAGIVTGGGILEATTTITDPITGISTTTTTDKGTFGMVAMRKQITGPVKGHVTYQNHGADDKVISVELTDLSFVGNKAVVGGVCKVDTSNCMTFRVEAEDNGQPWSDPRDRFHIAKDPLPLGGGVGQGGELSGGNIKVTRQQ